MCPTLKGMCERRLETNTVVQILHNCQIVNASYIKIKITDLQKWIFNTRGLTLCLTILDTYVIKTGFLCMEIV